MKTVSEKQSRMINVRMNEEETLGLSQLATQFKTSRSRLLRKIIRESIGEGPDLLPQEMKIVEEGIFQLAAVGRNLNQLLKLVHSRQVTVSSQEQALMENLREQVERLKREMLTVVDRTRERWVGHGA